MNRTNNKEFFRCWDLSKELAEGHRASMCPKEQLEYLDLVGAFLDNYGFPPTSDYQACIQAWIEELNPYYEI